MCKDVYIPKETQIKGKYGHALSSASKLFFFHRVLNTFIVFLITCLSFAYFAIPLLQTPHKSNCCAQYWFLAGTHWALACELIYFLCILYLHIQLAYDRNIESPANKAIWNIMKFTYAPGLTFSITIAMVYWPLIYGGFKDHFDVSVNVLQHGVSPIVFLIEYTFNLNTLNYSEIWKVLLFVAAYQITYVVHWALNGWTENGADDPIYSAIDLDEDFKNGAIYLGGIATVSIGVFILLTAIKLYITRMHHVETDRDRKKRQKSYREELEAIIDEET